MADDEQQQQQQPDTGAGEQQSTNPDVEYGEKAVDLSIPTREGLYVPIVPEGAVDSADLQSAIEQVSGPSETAPGEGTSTGDAGSGLGGEPGVGPAGDTD